MTHVLIVDDDPGDLQILSTAFEKTARATTIVTCPGAEEALALLDDTDRFQVGQTIVVTDLNMPQVDGFDLITKLRSRQDPPPVVIVLSTSSRSVEVDRAYRTGANAYHTKPMGFRETVDLCESIMDYWTSAAHLPSASPVVKALAYVSTPVAAFGQDDLADLGVRAAAFNRSHRVTGFLAFNHRRFLQFIEGPREGVEAVYQRIEADDRHRIDRNVVFGNRLRRFPAWSMQVISPTAVDELSLKGLFAQAEAAISSGEATSQNQHLIVDLASRMAVLREALQPEV